MNHLRQLWLKRRKDDLAETLPHWKYVFSSGFALLLAAVAITLIQGYSVLLHAVRETGELPLPLPLIGAVLLTPLLLWNPVRTYLAEADIVFLTPAEPAMEQYFRPAKSRGATRSTIAVASVLGLLWPFFLALGGSNVHYVMIISVVLLLKALLFYGAWMERQFESRALRIVFALVKFVALFASIHMVLRNLTGVAAVAAFAGIAAIWAAYAMSLRAPSAFIVHWEHLLREERSKQAMIERWFSQFVELPRSEEAYRRRAYLEPLLRLMTRGKAEGNAYLYLYWRTMLRSSLFWILIRLILLAYFFMFLFPGLWTGLSFYAGFVLLAGIQLKSLQSVRRDVMHLAVSPIPEEHRAAAVRTVRRTTHRLCNVAGALPLLVIIPWQTALAALIAGAFVPLLFGRGTRRTKRSR